MRKKTLLAAAFALVAVLACACGNASSSSGSAGKSSSGSGSKDTQTQTQTQAQQDQNQGQGTDEFAVDGGDEIDANATFDAQNQADAEGGDDDAEADPADADEQNGDNDSLSETGWTGTFYNDATEETLTVSNATDGAIEFAFAVSGIAGSAQRSGDTASYNGDDNFVISFALSGDQIQVSLSNTEDETETDGGGSPLIGTYVRE